MEIFNKYQPLFLDAINDGRIGVCKWIESGTTVSTAVPGLAEMTKDKDEWRAIIIRFEDEKCMSEFGCDSRNPFDFSVNSQMNNTVCESEVPIIRLTQILGGVPEPEVVFVEELITEEFKTPRIVYKPVYDTAQNESYKKLKEKYKYNGKMPSSIVIVTVRMDYIEDDTIDKAWQSHIESKSSEFWKRNKYPSLCRFIACDFEQQGPVKRDADEFNFWLSVLLLSTNEIDPGALQAYRLYRMNTEIDERLMARSMQNTVDRLKSARYSLEESIRRETEEKIKEEVTLPDYKLEIPVVLKVTNNNGSRIDKEEFGVLSRAVSVDVNTWERKRKEAEKLLETSFNSAERTLYITADKMRDNCTFTEDQVSDLDKYQKADLTREIQDIYHDIIDMQTTLPDDTVVDDEMVNASVSVKEYLAGRVVKESAITALAISFILMVLATVPAWIQYFKNGLGSLYSIIVSTLIGLIIIFAFAFAVLLAQKFKLNKMINTFNRLLKAAFNRITDNANYYSKYMSRIASHSRGNSYLNLSARKKHAVESAQGIKYKHIKAINVFLSRIRNWGRAYHLDIDYNAPYIEGASTIDITVPPSVNNMYTFETGKTYEAGLNKSGAEIDTPFGFVTSLNIVREELYDDESN